MAEADEEHLEEHEEHPGVGAFEVCGTSANGAIPPAKEIYRSSHEGVGQFDKRRANDRGRPCVNLGIRFSALV